MLKLLVLGNSFAEDTMEHAPSIAKSFGIDAFKLAYLYVGGCSIDMHYGYAMGDLPMYRYSQNTGDGWTSKHEVRISEALESDSFDVIVIQHGTNNGARYTSPECYKNLTPLINYIKEHSENDPRIAFNLTWLGESTRQHHEIISYKGDMAAMRAKLVEVTREVILGNPLVDQLIPTGTAIENARTSKIGLLTRDCYHLSMDKGRFIAALTFISSILGVMPEKIDRAPEGVDDYAMRVAVESASNAIKRPLEITESQIDK